MIETARGAEVRVLRGHRPRAEPVHAADDRREDARPAEAAGEARRDGTKMTLLHGTELNIDPDGEVDWGPEFLSGFDVTVASVHSMFNQSKDEMTRRIVRACENPYVNIIGHPTARKIGQRAPIEYDLDEVFAAAARTGTALEINAYPDRLDLRDEHVMWAKRHGVKFSIDTDSHSTVHLAHMRYGIGTAQRGWVTKDDVINAWPLVQAQGVPEEGPGLTAAPRDGGRPRPLSRRFFARPSPVVARELLGRLLVRRLGRRGAGRADRRDRGVPAGRPREPLVRGADGAQRGDVRAGRLPLCVFHVRHALLHERGDRAAGRGERGAAARGRAAGRAGGRWRAGAGVDGAAAALLGPGAADAGVRRDARSRTASDLVAGGDLWIAAGRRAPDDAVAVGPARSGSGARRTSRGASGSTAARSCRRRGRRLSRRRPPCYDPPSWPAPTRASSSSS